MVVTPSVFSTSMYFELRHTPRTNQGPHPLLSVFPVITLLVLLDLHIGDITYYH